MEIIEQIGFIHFWGLSPAINFLEDASSFQNKETINVLLEGTSDLRHFLKTVADNCRKNIENNKIKQLNVYVNEKQKEVVCRWLLLLQIIQTTSLSYRERVELFLDVFGNALIREKSQRYIDLILPTLLNLVAEETKKTRTPLENIFDFKEVKFKERDEMTDILNSWHGKVPFAIEKNRDQRLRYHYKERYDFRTNLIDWDYQMGLKDQASIIHFYHYKEWRQTGVAFEQRFSSYISPNRTLGSYLPGKKKLTNENVTVRGYWGDIIVSPYLSMGIQCDYEPEKEKLFKIANKQHVGHSVEVTEYNLQYWIEMIETLKEYHMVFTDMYRADKKDDKKKEEKVKEKKKKKKEETDTIKEENEEEEEEEKEDKKEQKDEEEQDKEEKKEEVEDEKQEEKEEDIQEGKDKNQKAEDKEVPKPEKTKEEETEDLKGLSPEEVEKRQKLWREKKEKEDYQIGTEVFKLLQGFDGMKIKVIPIFEDVSKLATKKKFQELFDVAVVGFGQSGVLKNAEFVKVLKNNSLVYSENTAYIVPIKKEERIQLNQTIVDLASQLKMKHIKDYPDVHHYKFQLEKA